MLRDDLLFVKIVVPISAVNGVRLYGESLGDQGPPVLLVHGSWGDHHNWDGVVPALAQTCRVLTYDRRGHSQSERLTTQGCVADDVADLSALISEHNFAPVHLIGNSFGALISLNLAATRPGLLATLTMHEPPMIGLLGGDPRLASVQQRIEAVVARLQEGETERGAQLFVETVALGPGMWERLSPVQRQTFVFNAPTFLDEMSEPGWSTLDLARLAFSQPALLTQGDQSPPFFAAILDRIAAALPHARRHTFRGAGHAPHISHAADFVNEVAGFIAGS